MGGEAHFPSSMSVWVVIIIKGLKSSHETGKMFHKSYSNNIQFPLWFSYSFLALAQKRRPLSSLKLLFDIIKLWHHHLDAHFSRAGGTADGNFNSQEHVRHMMSHALHIKQLNDYIMTEVGYEKALNLLTSFVVLPPVSALIGYHAEILSVEIWIYFDRLKEAMVGCKYIYCFLKVTSKPSKGIMALCWPMCPDNLLSSDPRLGSPHSLFLDH